MNNTSTIKVIFFDKGTSIVLERMATCYRESGWRKGITCLHGDKITHIQIVQLLFGVHPKQRNSFKDATWPEPPPPRCSVADHGTLLRVKGCIDCTPFSDEDRQGYRDQFGPFLCELYTQVICFGLKKQLITFDQAELFAEFDALFGDYFLPTMKERIAKAFHAYGGGLGGGN